MVVGELQHRMGKEVALGVKQGVPGVRWRNNAVQFTNNPFGGVSAITIGNTTTYQGDPDDPNDPFWYRYGGDPRTFENGHSISQHEKQHTIQGQQLGPAYLPSNLLGGAMGLLLDRDEDGLPNWHGPHNWNERGPQANPPRPWATKGPQ